MKLKKPLLAFLVIAFSLANIFIVYNLYTLGSLAPSTSNASADGKLLLNLTSPLSLASLTNNSTVTVSLTAQNTQSANVAEIVLSFNPNVLTGTQITENSSILLALNKKIDNSAGKITVDIAFEGDGDLPANTDLVDFTFKVIDNTKNDSTVAIANGSTLGTPNKLSATGMGSLPIDFKTSVVTPAAVCGNGVLEGAEKCDDGNTTNGDGCSSTCSIEAPAPTDNTTVPTVVDNGTTTTPTTTPDTTNTPSTTPSTTTNNSQTTTTSNSSSSTSSDIISNRNILIGGLVVTLFGTIISLFFLVKTLVFKDEVRHSKAVNPFI